MATKTKTATTPQPNPWLIWAAIAALILAAILLLVILLQQQPPAHIPLPGERGSIEVHYHDHALRHSEAPLVRMSCERGPEMIFKYRWEDKFSFLCFTEKGWGVMIIQKIKGVWEEVNSFVPKDGTKEAVLQYLDGFATPFKGLLP